MLTLQTTIFVAILGRAELKLKAFCHCKQTIICSMTVENTAFHSRGISSTARTGNPKDEVSGPAATQKRRPNPRTQSKLPSLTTKKMKLIIVMPANNGDCFSKFNGNRASEAAFPWHSTFMPEGQVARHPLLMTDMTTFRFVSLR